MFYEMSKMVTPSYIKLDDLLMTATNVTYDKLSE